MTDGQTDQHGKVQSRVSATKKRHRNLVAWEADLRLGRVELRLEKPWRTDMKPETANLRLRWLIWSLKSTI